MSIRNPGRPVPADRPDHKCRRSLAPPTRGKRSDAARHDMRGVRGSGSGPWAAVFARGSGNLLTSCSRKKRKGGIAPLGKGSHNGRTGSSRRRKHARWGANGHISVRGEGSRRPVIPNPCPKKGSTALSLWCARAKIHSGQKRGRTGTARFMCWRGERAPLRATKKWGPLALLGGHRQRGRYQAFARAKSRLRSGL